MSSRWSPRGEARRRYEHQLPCLDRAPPGVLWRTARQKQGDPVKAELARSTGAIETPRGALLYEAGKHYLVHYAPGDCEPMRRRRFERLFRRRGDGRYERRVDHPLRYFSLAYPVLVETEDGVQLAQPGDWIMEGSAGELWPVSQRDAQDNYDPA